LNEIHPSYLPVEVRQMLNEYVHEANTQSEIEHENPIDRWGRVRVTGGRKTSRGVTYLVAGEGKVMVNGVALANYFQDLLQREKVIWPLQIAQRMSKYNVWAIVRGGGPTGQSEAIAHMISKALIMHEPELKAVLRAHGLVTRDRRRVERKKAGFVKSRKRPTWVKR